jgi:uncharacterized protein (DUF1499 family)
MKNMVCGMVMILMMGCSSSLPDNIGLAEGRLSACPDSPNCVLSQMKDKDNKDKHYIAPLDFNGSRKDAMASLENIITGMKRTQIVTKTESYVHVEFTTGFFRFVDDVEFLADDKANVIHVRSASRVGKSDFGVNRKRIEKIRELLLRTSEGKLKS